MQSFQPFTSPTPASQPASSLDRQVFDAYYVYRVKPVKTAADALGISRKHFYSLLSAFRVRVANAGMAIEQENSIQNEQLNARRTARAMAGL